MSALGNPLSGQWVLVVEDEYLTATELVRELELLGATGVGPVADVRRALQLVQHTPRLDLALLDIRLRDEPVYPIADALRARGVPFVFVSGFEPDFIPARYRAVPLYMKPVDLRAVIAALSGMRADMV